MELAAVRLCPATYSADRTRHKKKPRCGSFFLPAVRRWDLGVHLVFPTWFGETQTLSARRVKICPGLNMSSPRHQRFASEKVSKTPDTGPCARQLCR